MAVGAIDPTQGSLLILPGSGLLALGSLVGHSQRRVIAYQMLVFILVAIGVGAFWGLSAVGGFGGSTGHSLWWGLLILPYLVGWSMSVWGPGAPSWLCWLGVLVSLWYLAIFGAVTAWTGLWHADAAVVVGALGAITIGGCIWRLNALLREATVDPLTLQSL